MPRVHHPLTRIRHIRSLLRAGALVAGLALVYAANVVVAGQSRLVDAPSLVNDLRQLSSDEMAGRRVGTPGGARARAYLMDRFLAVGLLPFSGAFEKPFGGAVAGVNLIGQIPGHSRPDQFIVISAHYDHIGVRNGQTFNGANDNASGAAALPALAAYFLAHRPATSLIFAAFDGEEAGLLGSRAFVRAPPVDRNAILINLNLDMIGRDPSNTLWVVGTARQPALRPLIERAATGAPVSLRMGYENAAGGQDWTRDSDQWAFLEGGLPALYFGVEDFALLHHPDDDFERMTIDFYIRAVETMVQVIEMADADAEALARLPRGTGATPR